MSGERRVDIGSIKKQKSRGAKFITEIARLPYLSFPFIDKAVDSHAISEWLPEKKPWP